MAEKKLPTYNMVVLHARAHRNFRSLLTQHLKPHGLTVMEWALLGLVSDAHKSGMSVTELADKLSVKTALASVMVSKQAKAGVLEKVASKRDNRLRQVCITDEGRQRINKIETELHAALSDWFKSIGVTDLDSYTKTLALLSEATR